MTTQFGWRTTFYLAIILTAAGFFYFYHITEHGIFDMEEAGFMTVSNSYALLLRGVPREEVIGLHAVWGFSSLGRPLSILANIPGFYFFGHNDYTASVTNGILSLFSIFVLYLIAREATKSELFALFSAAIFAVSGYQVFFARSALAHVLAGFLFLTGALFYIKTLSAADAYSRRDYLVGSGISWGLMLAAHYGTLVLLGLVLVFEWATSGIRQVVRPDLVRRLIYLLLPVFVSFSSVFVLYAIGSHSSISLWKYIGATTSVIVDANSNLTHYGPLLGLREPLFYLRVIQTFSGWPFLFLFLLVPWFIFVEKKIRKNIAEVFIAFIAITALLIFSILPLVGARIIPFFGGFIALSASLSLFELLSLLKGKWRLAAITLAGMYIIFQMQIDKEIIKIKSNYKNAAEQFVSLNFTHKPLYSLYCEPIASFYLDRHIGVLDKVFSGNQVDSRLLAGLPKTMLVMTCANARLDPNSKIYKKVELLSELDDTVYSPFTIYAPGGRYDMNHHPKTRFYQVELN